MPDRRSGAVRPLQLVPGDPVHGVVEFARALADAAACPVLTDAGALPASARVHLHFTERLWGDSPEAAATAVRALAAQVPLSVTLHDLPQASDGAAGSRRRTAYAQVVELARGVVCNSEWELELLRAFVPGARAEVIPLPVPGDGRAAWSRPVRSGSATVALLGWIYPGKGHAAAIDAVATLAASGAAAPEVRALGRPSPGHADDVAALAARADRAGVRFAVTGYLEPETLRDELAAATVPLAAHAHFSASASITTWLAAGRRPLVPDVPYTREAEALRPATLWRYAPEQLHVALAAALARPHRTWLEADVDLRPGPAQTAAAYLRWWTEEVAW